MNQKPVPGPFHPNTQGYYYKVDQRHFYPQQEHQNSQHQRSYPQYHGYPNPMEPSAFPNPTYPSNLEKPEQQHSSVAASQKIDDNNHFPQNAAIASRGLATQAPSNHPTTTHQNQDALQQLENNLRLVLKQQQQQEQQCPSKQLSQNSRSEKMYFMSEQRNQDSQVECDGALSIQNSGGHYNSATTTPTFQNKTVAMYPISSDKRFSYSTTDDQANTNINGCNETNIVSKRQKRNNDQSPCSHSSPLSSPKINPTSNRLFALADEVQPLSASSISQPLSPLHKDALLQSWSEGTSSEEVASDIFMNNLFHAELKTSRQNTTMKNNTKTDLLPEDCDSNQRSQLVPYSKADKEIEPMVSLREEEPSRSPIRHTPKLVYEDYGAFVDIQEKLPSKQLKGKIKQSKKKSKRELSAPKRPKQRRKKWSKRKPKLLNLQKDPPVEEQILSLPVIVLAPSLLVRLIRNNPMSHSTVSNNRIGANDISFLEVDSLNKRQNRNGNVYTGKFDVSDDDSDDDMSPGQTFDKILRDRGHDETYSVDSEGTEYDVVPSHLQLASYGTYLVWAIHSSNTSLVRELLRCGLSPNPCNQFRDSLLGDLVCKQGKEELYKCFVDEFHADIRVVDGFGRTLLHHCCWAQELCRPIVEDILKRDPIQMFLKDKQGKIPLEYIRTEIYGPWKKFLKDVADQYWPAKRKLPRLPAPVLGRRQPNGELTNPPEALTPEIAASVVSGSLTPEAISTMIGIPGGKNSKQRR